MNFAVCDDETIFREELIRALYDAFGKLELSCASFSDGDKLLDAYKQGQRFDAVFLDIEMPGRNGMETAGELRSWGFVSPIIFLTSHTELAMDGYEVAAFRFLSKPVKAEKLQKTLYDLKAELSEKNRLMIRYEGEELVLLLEDIVYVEARNNQISIVTTSQEYTIRKKISDIENELKNLSDCFVRIHRGYIVNLSYVKKHHGNEVFITKDTALPLSRGYVNHFKEQLFEYVRNSAR